MDITQKQNKEIEAVSTNECPEEVKKQLELTASQSSIHNHEYSVRIDETPWTQENTQDISFEEFRARIHASHELQKAIEDDEKNMVSELNLAAAVADTRSQTSTKQKSVKDVEKIESEEVLDQQRF